MVQPGIKPRMHADQRRLENALICVDPRTSAADFWSFSLPRHLWVVFFCVGIILACVVREIHAKSTARRVRRPNIVFIQTDDQAAWTLGYTGNREAYTPNLDHLFRQGAYLRNSFVTTPVCSPSRAGLMTSRYGTELGITDWLNPQLERELGLSPEIVTWPKLLMQAGYNNGIVGKWHLGMLDRYHPTKFGFQYFMGFRGGNADVKDPKFEVEGQRKNLQGLTPDILTDDAINFIRHHQANPFMLMLNFREPHHPWMPVAETDWAPYKDLDPTIPNPDYPKLNVPLVKKMMREYLASVTSVDRNVGRLLAALDELKLSDNTIVIFTSDHGYNMGHNGIWHKGNGHWILTDNTAMGGANPRGQRPNLYDNSLRVPSAVRWPGVIKPGIINQTITNMDWYPTILAMVGVAPPKLVRLHGRNFFPLLQGKKIKWNNDLYAEYSQHHYAQTHLRMYRTPRWKLVRDFRNSGKDELYHLAVDPAESKNLINDAAWQSTRAQLEKKLLTRMRELNDPVLKGKAADGLIPNITPLKG